MKKIHLTLPILCLLTLTACSALTSKPPTKIEEKLFDIKTNYVPVVVLQTNVVTVTQTNQVTVRDTVTQVLYQTNQVTVQTVGTNIVTVTNVIPSYEFSTKPAVLQDVQTAGAVTNTFLPGWGTLVSTALTGLMGLWATVRTRKQNAINANLTQIIETARSVIKSLPNGAAVGAQFDAFLLAHQDDADLLAKIGAIVDKYVNRDEAQGAATNILTTASTVPGVQPTVVAAARSSNS